MQLSVHILKITLTASLTAFLVACASTAPQPWDRPVIVTKIGRSLPDVIVDACIAKAKAAGLTPLLKESTPEKVLRNQEYRNHVGKCVQDQDYIILGWN
jgi:hypothetical protein